MNEFYTQLTEDFPEFFMVNGDNRGRYPYSNSMMVKTDDMNAILFDCGIGRKILRKVRRDINIEKVYLSHWHEDHTSGYDLLRESEYFSHILDFPPLQNLDTFVDYYGAGDLDGPLWEGYAAVLKFLRIQPIPNLNKIGNGDKISLPDGEHIEIIHTPGHTGGHCCFYEPLSRIIFLADIDLSGLGPWYGCTDSNVNDFEISIELLLTLDIEYAITGHSGLFQGKKEIKNALENYLKVIYDRDERILALLSEETPRSVDDIEGKNTIYRKYEAEFAEYLVFAENVMNGYHLERLLQLGKVKKENSGYILS